VGVCQNGDKSGGSDDGGAGVAVGGDITEFNSEEIANTLSVFAMMGTKP
jgi:hypothetical protein